MGSDINPYASSVTPGTRITNPSRGWRIAGRLAVLAVTASYLWSTISVCLDRDAFRQNLVLVALLGSLGVFGLFVMAMPFNRFRHLWFLQLWSCLSALVAFYLAIAPIVVKEWLLVSWNGSLVIASMFSIFAFRKAFDSDGKHEHSTADGG